MSRAPIGFIVPERDERVGELHRHRGSRDDHVITTVTVPLGTLEYTRNTRLPPAYIERSPSVDYASNAYIPHLSNFAEQWTYLQHPGIPTLLKRRLLDIYR